MSAQRKYIHGTVNDSSITSILQQAHIQNITAGKLAVLDAYGRFRIPALVGDTLIISHIGFQDLTCVVEEDWFTPELLEFELRPDPIFLPEVVINDFPDYARFKQLILEAEPEPELEIYGMATIPAFQKEVSEEDLQNSTVGLSFAIPFNLDGLSKKGREKKKMQEILQNRRKSDIANQKFNREWVSEMTKLEGDELTDFIAYCKFSVDYLAETAVYEIHIKMMALLDDFNSEKDES